MKALDIALQETANMGPPADDEFTVDDYIRSKEDLGEPVSYSVADRALKRMVASGTLKSRKGRIKGSLWNVYRRA